MPPLEKSFRRPWWHAVFEKRMLTSNIFRRNATEIRRGHRPPRSGRAAKLRRTRIQPVRTRRTFHFPLRRRPRRLPRFLPWRVLKKSVVWKKLTTSNTVAFGAATPPSRSPHLPHRAIGRRLGGGGRTILVGVRVRCDGRRTSDRRAFRLCSKQRCAEVYRVIEPRCSWRRVVRSLISGPWPAVLFFKSSPFRFDVRLNFFSVNSVLKRSFYSNSSYLLQFP